MNYLFLTFLFVFLTGVDAPINRIKDSGFNDEQISYFSETAFYNNSWLSRWEKPIKIQCIGDYSSTDIKKINAIIQEVRPVLGGLPIQIVNDDGDLLIHFESDLFHFDDANIFKGEQVPFGYMKPTLNAQHSFLSADIYIHPLLTGNKKYEVLRHEFCHALGLMSHANKAFKTKNLLGKIIFSSEADYKNWKNSQNIPILDLQAIKLLYQEHLPLNYSKQDFDRAYRNASFPSHFIVSSK